MRDPSQAVLDVAARFRDGNIEHRRIELEQLLPCFEQVSILLRVGERGLIEDRSGIARVRRSGKCSVARFQIHGAPSPNTARRPARSKPRRVASAPRVRAAPMTKRTRSCRSGRNRQNYSDAAFIDL